MAELFPLLEHVAFCWDCKQSKAFTEFRIKKNGKPYSYCRECEKRHGREAHQRRKQARNNPPVPEKQCPSCKEIKPAAAYYLAPILRDGLSFECRACNKNRHRHYAKRIKGATPIPVGHKRCPQCQTIKPAQAFSKNRARKDHLDSHCKECVRKPQRDRYLKHTYGLRAEQYEMMLRLQGGVCAICQKTETVIHLGKTPPLSVDHDHVTKAIRGLLCYRCNHLVGFIERFGTEGLDKAQAYLKKHFS